MKLPRHAALPLLVCTVTAVYFAAAPTTDAPPSLGAAEPKAAPEFSKAGPAFLKKHCVACHAGEKPKADLMLDGFTDEASVLKERKKWQAILHQIESGEMPPREKPRPAMAEIEAVTASVRGLFAKADQNAKPDPGRVTVRRLNKVEYNNTIRDLVGVDFNPAEDFPSDDVGHGFDNIGDVLTLSPVLLERYLAAAEAIVSRAITPVPPPVTARWTSTQFSEPAAAKIPFKNQYREIKVKPDGPALETGPIFVRVQVPGAGEYNFRTRVYAETTGKQPVKVAVLAGLAKDAPGAATDAEVDKLAGAAVKSLRPFRIIETIEVKARTAKDAPQTTIKLPPGVVPDKVALAVVKPPEGEPAPAVFVQFMSLDGPLDSRPATHRKLLACDQSKPPTARTREVLTRFATKAYRRPATTDEVERLAKLVEAAEARGEKWEAGMQVAFQAVLVSPKFLFRLELDDRPDAAGVRPLDEYQLASRLSYFLWSTMPDDELFDLAAKKQLTANLDAQVKRMLTDPKAKALVDNFVMQWLQLRTLKNFQPDAKQFPQFNDKLRAAMLKETELFFTALIKEDRSILDVLDADFTYLNAPLARHYGIADTAGNPINAKQKKPGGKPFRDEAFERVSLPAGGQRGGVLTQASVLSVTSNPTRTSPVKRGRWVLEQLLGTPPPPPPPNVPELPGDAKAAATGSLRQRLEQHRANPSCANCHAKMDPLGFAFENFDATGAFRAKDGDFPIDPSGELPDGKKFQGPQELKVILKEKQDLFTRCLAEKLLTYATGRGLEYYDKRAVDRICESAAKEGLTFSAVVREIVKSEPFRLRRGKESP
jgi:mono/diheme cytochrome c family protein